MYNRVLTVQSITRSMDKPEITQLADSCSLLIDNILRFKVAVEYSHLVQVRHSVTNLDRDQQLSRDRYLHVKLVHKVKQICSLNELLDQRICAVVVMNSQELDYIGMLDMYPS